MLEMEDISSEVVFLLILQTLVFLMACSGNAIVVIVIWKYIRRSAVTNRFIVNLAVADMFTGLTALSQLMYTFNSSLNDNMYTCLMRYQVVIFMTLTSQLTVTFTTFDRYIAICHPCHYTYVMSVGVANVLIFASWIYPLILSALPFTGLNTWNTYRQCLFQQIVSPWQLLWMALTLWVFTIVTVIMYILILRKACSLYNKVKNKSESGTNVTVIHVSELGNHSNIEDNQERNNRKSYRNEKMSSMLRGAKALAAVTILFSICWLPYTYFQVRSFINQDYVYSPEWHVSTWVVFIGMAISVMNPFIYAWQRKDFNQACKRLLSGRPPIRGPFRRPSNTFRAAF